MAGAESLEAPVQLAALPWVESAATGRGLPGLRGLSPSHQPVSLSVSFFRAAVIRRKRNQAARRSPSSRQRGGRRDYKDGIVPGRSLGLPASKESSCPLSFLRPLLPLAALLGVVLTAGALPLAGPILRHAGITVRRRRVHAGSPRHCQSAEAGEPRLRVPAGFEVELVAAEPLVINPITMALDEQGRIYVSESHTYRYGPSGSPIKPFTNPIVRLDPLSGGKGYKRIVVAEGFDDPVMGMAVRDGKLWATANNYLYLFDLSDDGKASNRRTLVVDRNKAWNPFGMFVLEWRPRQAALPVGRQPRHRHRRTDQPGRRPRFVRHHPAHEARRQRHGAAGPRAACAVHVRVRSVRATVAVIQRRGQPKPLRPRHRRRRLPLLQPRRRRQRLAGRQPSAGAATATR